MGRIKWTEKLRELNSLKAGLVVIGLESMVDPDCTDTEALIVGLPLGFVDLDERSPVFRIVGYDLVINGTGYIVGYGETVARAVDCLWSRLHWDVPDCGCIVLHQEGEVLGLRENKVTRYWEAFDLSSEPFDYPQLLSTGPE